MAVSIFLFPSLHLFPSLDSLFIVIILSGHGCSLLRWTTYNLYLVLVPNFGSCFSIVFNSIPVLSFWWNVPAFWSIPVFCSRKGALKKEKKKYLRKKVIKRKRKKKWYGKKLPIRSNYTGHKFPYQRFWYGKKQFTECALFHFTSNSTGHTFPIKEASPP